MAEKLTPQQAEAVHNRGGKLLVSAAAGSGKTKVLVDRLLSYLTDPVSPANLDEFLIITYTKAAAAELRGKIASKLTERIAEKPEDRHLQQQLQRLYLTKISTVHAFCADLLREYAYKLDLPADFRVADENECRELRERAMDQILEQAYEHVGEDEAFTAFVDTQGLGRNDSLVPVILMQVYDSARCNLDPEGWLASCIENADVTGKTDAGETVWGRLLIDDLFSYLDLQIEAMDGCANSAEAYEGWEKPAAQLRDTVYQLQHLRASATWDEIVARKNIDYGRLVFSKKAGTPEDAERIKAVREACKKGLAGKLTVFSDDSSVQLGDLQRSSQAVQGMVNLVNAFAKRYDDLKKTRRVMDFSDLEHKTLDLLLGKSRTGRTAVAAEIGRRFREIMVDEYQDSNGVQDAIFGALTEERNNLFMVGDVKQSIYQFRLADPGIFLEKYAAFIPAEQAEAGQGRKVLLSSNFRSASAVISAVNDVFSLCMSEQVGGLAYGENEKLREGIPHVPAGEPEVEFHGIVVKEDTYREEAEYTADRIQELLSGSHMIRQGDVLRPIAPDDVVILLRSPSSAAEVFQKALERRGIRCNSGGGTNLLKTEEIGTMRSILQTVSNPRQDIPLIAALCSPAFGFSADDLAQIRSVNPKVCFYEALLESCHPKAEEFLKILEVLRKESRTGSLAQLIEEIYALTSVDSIYGAMSDGSVRINNLQTFYQLVAGYEAGGLRSLEQLLEHLDSMEEKGLSAGDDAAGAGAVTIMSIHKSKGLEFPVVFLCNLSRSFNRESMRAQVMCHKDLGLGLSCVDKENRVRYPTIAKRAIAAQMTADSLSEEMRVLYVAMTRAKDRLIMTYASKSLEKETQELACRMDAANRNLITGSVSCPGQWVLMAALHRTEAGELFQLGGKPKETMVSDHPWKIVVSEYKEKEEMVDAVKTTEEEKKLPDEAVKKLQEGLAFHYGHLGATVTPSKQTVTQRKGRFRDQEAEEQTDSTVTKERSWRRASFIEKDTRGKTYGSAIHAAMQYIRYEACTDLNGVMAELERMKQEGFLKEEQAAAVDCKKIAALFASDLGKSLRESKHVLREFKFSILDDAELYGTDLEGEKVLLQGVVDCAMLEEDGITVVDYKTDHIQLPELEARTAYYRKQIETYADALSRIYQLPIKKKILYFFNLDAAVEV